MLLLCSCLTEGGVGVAGVITIFPDSAQQPSIGSKVRVHSPGTTTRLCFTIDSESLPQCGDDGERCVVGAPVYNNSFLPWRVTSNNPVLRIMACSADNMHSALRTVVYSTVRPGPIMLDHTVYRNGALVVAGGHRVALSSEGSELICYTVDNSVPSCADSSQSATCSSSCISCHVTNASSQGLTIPIHFSYPSLNAIGCTFSTGLASDLFSVALNVTVEPPRFSPPTATVTTAERTWVNVTAAGATHLCISTTLDLPECSRFLRSCAAGVLHVGEATQIAVHAHGAPFQVLRAQACRFDGDSGVAWRPSDVVAAVYSHEYTFEHTTANTEECDTKPWLPQCDGCDTELQTVQIGMRRSRKCTIPLSPRWYSVNKEAIDALQGSEQNKAEKHCQQLAWPSARTGHGVPYDDAYICGRGGGCTGGRAGTTAAASLCEGDLAQCFKVPETGVTHGQARSFCSAVGARLCSLAEILRGEALDGCHDQKHAWTSTPCAQSCAWSEGLGEFVPGNGGGYYKAWGGGYPGGISQVGREQCASAFEESLSGIKCCSAMDGYDEPEEDLFYDDQRPCFNVTTEGWYTDLIKSDPDDWSVDPTINIHANTTSRPFCSGGGSLCHEIHGPFPGTTDLRPGLTRPMSHQTNSGLAHCRSHIVKTFAGLGTAHDGVRLAFHYVTTNKWGLRPGQKVSLLHEVVHTPRSRPLSDNSSISFRNPPESARSYSSVWDNNAVGTGHAQSMLGSPLAWVAGVGLADSFSEWMQIDLGKPMPVRGVVVQRRHDSDQMVKKYQVATSLDGMTFYPAEVDGETIGYDSSTYPDLLPDSTSSNENGNFMAKHTLNGEYADSPANAWRTTNSDPTAPDAWIKYTIPAWRRVREVRFQQRHAEAHQVTSVSISFSEGSPVTVSHTCTASIPEHSVVSIGPGVGNQGATWMKIHLNGPGCVTDDGNKQYGLTEVVVSYDDNWPMLEGIHSQDNKKKTYLFKNLRAINAQYVRFYPKWSMHRTSMRAGVVVHGPEEARNPFPQRRTYSSTWDTNHIRSELDSAAQVSHRFIFKNAPFQPGHDFVQLDVGTLQTITAVRVEDGHADWEVNQYSFKYSLRADGPYMDIDQGAEFDVSTTGHSGTYTFVTPIYGRFVRLYPTSTRLSNQVSLRVGLYVNPAISVMEASTCPAAVGAGSVPLPYGAPTPYLEYWDATAEMWRLAWNEKIESLESSTCGQSGKFRPYSPVLPDSCHVHVDVAVPHASDTLTVRLGAATCEENLAAATWAFDGFRLYVQNKSGDIPRVNGTNAPTKRHVSIEVMAQGAYSSEWQRNPVVDKGTVCMDPSRIPGLYHTYNCEPGELLQTNDGTWHSRSCVGGGGGMCVVNTLQEEKRVGQRDTVVQIAGPFGVRQVSPTELHGVVCCVEDIRFDASPDATGRTYLPPKAFSYENFCDLEKTFWEAQNLCDNFGARLCGSYEEMQDKTSGTCGGETTGFWIDGGYSEDPKMVAQASVLNRHAKMGYSAVTVDGIDVFTETDFLGGACHYTILSIHAHAGTVTSKTVLKGGSGAEELRRALVSIPIDHYIVLALSGNWTDGAVSTLKAIDEVFDEMVQYGRATLMRRGKYDPHRPYILVAYKGIHRHDTPSLRVPEGPERDRAGVRNGGFELHSPVRFLSNNMAQYNSIDPPASSLRWSGDAPCINFTTLATVASISVSSPAVLTFKGQTSFSPGATLTLYLDHPDTFASCQDAFEYDNGRDAVSGLYHIHGKQVYCDMTEDGGGWMLAVVIDGTDQAHSSIGHIGANTIVPQTAVTSKYDDVFINSLTGAMDGDRASIKFECGTHRQFFKDCVFCANCGLAAVDGCVRSYVSEHATSVLNDVAGDSGSGGLGSHIHSQGQHAQAYCSKCPGGSAAVDTARLGCGHDDNGYAKKGKVWVRTQAIHAYEPYLNATSAHTFQVTAVNDDESVVLSALDTATACATDLKTKQTRACLATLRPSIYGAVAERTPENRRSYSSFWNNNWKTSSISSGTASRITWRSQNGHLTGQWMQLDLGVPTRVGGVVTQGRADANQWVTKYQVEYKSGFSWVLVDGGYEFSGNLDRSTQVKNYFDSTVVTRYIKILVTAHHGHVAMRADVLPPLADPIACSEDEKIVSKEERHGVQCCRNDGGFTEYGGNGTYGFHRAKTYAEAKQICENYIDPTTGLAPYRLCHNKSELNSVIEMNLGSYNRGKSGGFTMTSENTKACHVLAGISEDSCVSTNKRTDPNTCQAHGMEIVIPRSKDHWDTLLSAFDISYFDTMPGIYKPTGGGSFTNVAMNSEAMTPGGYRSLDGGPWWLRATPFSEPNGDYHANCWLDRSDLGSSDDIRFNDGNCGAWTGGKYVCSTNYLGPTPLPWDLFTSVWLDMPVCTPAAVQSGVVKQSFGSDACDSGIAPRLHDGRAWCATAVQTEGAAVVVEDTNFDDDHFHGWTCGAIQSCQLHKICGGYTVGGAHHKVIEKTVEGFQVGTAYTISLDIWAMDSWDNEWVYVDIDGKNEFSMAWQHNWAGGQRMCGRNFKDKMIHTFEHTLTAMASAVHIKVHADLNSNAEDESLAIDNVKIIAAGSGPPSTKPKILATKVCGASSALQDPNDGFTFSDGVPSGGWRLRGDVHSVKLGSALLKGLVPPEGKFCAALVGHGATMYQSIHSPTPGKSFFVTFSTASQPGSGVNELLDVYVNNVLALGSYRPPEHSFTNMSVLVPGTSTKELFNITFTNSGPPDRVPSRKSIVFIDNVQPSRFYAYETAGNLHAVPAAVSFTLPLMTSMHVSSSFLPLWGGRRGFVEVFSDNVDANEVSMSPYCHKPSSGVYYWAARGSQDCGYDVVVADRWYRTIADSGVQSAVHETMAYGYSGNTHDDAETSTLLSSQDQNPCEDSTIAERYGNSGRQRCRTMHGPFSGGNSSLSRVIWNITNGSKYLRLRLRVFVADTWFNNDSCYVRIHYGDSNGNSSLSQLAWESSPSEFDGRGEIADTQQIDRSYSTIHDTDWGKESRISDFVSGGHKTWHAKDHNANQYVTLDMNVRKAVLGVITQGRVDYPWHWVKAYTVEYSNDFINWYDVDDGAIFAANVDQHSKVTNYFAKSVFARYIKINPTQWNGVIAMRFDAIIPSGAGPFVECKGDWKEWNFGMYSYNDAHINDPSGRRRVSRCYHYVDTVVKVPVNASYVRVEIGAKYRGKDHTEGWWGFDQLTLEKEIVENSTIFGECPGQQCPRECLLYPEDPVRAFYEYHCSSLEACSTMQTRLKQDPNECRVALQKLSSSRCAPKPFQDPLNPASLPGHLGCQVCGRDFSCVRNEPFPDTEFIDPIRGNGTRYGKRSIRKISIVAYGSMAFEASQGDLNEALVQLNGVMLAAPMKGAGTPGRLECNDCYSTKKIVLEFGEHNEDIYIYGDIENGIDGRNRISISPPKDMSWCISHIDVQVESVPSPATIDSVYVISPDDSFPFSSKNASRVNRLNTNGGDRVLLIGSNFGPAFASVSYGHDGFGFVPTNCSTFAPYRMVTCSTVPGIGQHLRWTVIANAQTGLLSNVTSSYNNPRVMHALNAVIDTNGEEWIVVNGTLLTNVALVVTAIANGRTARTLQDFQNDRLQVQPPALLDNIYENGTVVTARNITFRHSMGTLSRDGNPHVVQVNSGFVGFTYTGPTITGAYLTYEDGYKNARLELHGRNFCGSSNCASFLFCPVGIESPPPCVGTNLDAQTEDPYRVALHPGVVSAVLPNDDTIPITTINPSVTPHLLRVGDLVLPNDFATGLAHSNGQLLAIVNVTFDQFSLLADSTTDATYVGGGELSALNHGGVPPIPVQSVTIADARVTTQVIHGLATGNAVVVHGVASADGEDQFDDVNLLRLFRITVINTLEFTLDNLVLTDHAGNGTSGGWVVPLLSDTTKHLISKISDAAPPDEGSTITVTGHPFVENDGVRFLGMCVTYDDGIVAPTSLFYVRVVDENTVMLSSTFNDTDLPPVHFTQVSDGGDCVSVLFASKSNAIRVRPSIQTQTYPAKIITLEPHTFSANDTIVLGGVGGQDELNGIHTVLRTTASTISLLEFNTSGLGGYGGHLKNASFRIQTTFHSHEKATFSMPEVNMYPIYASITVLGKSSAPVFVSSRATVISALSASVLRQTVYPTAGAGVAESGCCSLSCSPLGTNIDEVKVMINSVAYNIRSLMVTSVSESTVDVAFDVPPGEGTDVPVQVVSGVTPSSPVYISYAPPRVLEIRPRYIATNGSVVEIHGHNFGTIRPSVTIAGTPCHVLSYSQTIISAMGPEGEGSSDLLVIVTVGGQHSCDQSNGCPETKVNYYPPLINRVELPSERPTHGGFLIKIHGQNFGSPTASLSALLSSVHTCELINHTHVLAFCRAPPGAGAGLSLTMVVSTLVATKPGSVSYSTPRVEMIRADRSDGKVPTSGRNVDVVRDVALLCSDGSLPVSDQEIQFLYEYYRVDSMVMLATKTKYFKQEIMNTILRANVESWSRPVHIKIRGNNFGTLESPIAVQTYAIGGENPVATMDLVFRNHTYLVVRAAPGEGSVIVAVDVVGQKSTFYNTGQNVLTYSAPVVKSIHYPQTVGQYAVPTTGCAVYEENIPSGLNDRVCTLDGRTLIALHGENFGISPPTVELTSGAGEVSTSCVVVSFTHYEIIFELAPGLGKISIRVRKPSLGIVSSVPTFLYSAPDITRVSWGKSVEDASSSWTYNAAGARTDDDMNRLYIFGENFGHVWSPVNVSLGGQVCRNAKWHDASIYSSPPGSTYLTCMPARSRVGAQSLSVTVAFQDASPTKAVHARCHPGYYGRSGEFCVKCWQYTDGKRTLDAAKCSGEYTAPLRRDVTNLTFATAGGTEEPIPEYGFSSFPPPECMDGGCVPAVFSGAEDIPPACLPVVDKIAGKWAMPETCNEAENVGQLCHPDRFGGYCFEDFVSGGINCTKDPSDLIKMDEYGLDLSSIRAGCSSIMPCSPVDACGPNNTCNEGYVSYYLPYSFTAAIYPVSADGTRNGVQETARSNVPVCKVGHYTLPDGRCYAPRCGQCNPLSHFRLDGVCTPCPEYPWLIPVILAGGSVLMGTAMVLLSRSGVSFVILNIGIDYVQVLSLFSGARVKWPPIMLEVFIYLRIFSLDIDLAAPECFLREVFTFELKFFFKMSLPLLAMSALMVVVLIVVLKRYLADDQRGNLKRRVRASVGKKKVKNTKVRPATRETVAPEQSKTAENKEDGAKISRERKAEKNEAADSGPEIRAGGIVSRAKVGPKTKSTRLPLKKKRRTEPQTVQAMFSMVISLFVSMTYFLYLIITRAALEIWNCEPTIPPTGKYFMMAAPEEQCYTNNNLRDRLLPLANTALLFYTVGFPFVIAIFFKKNEVTIKVDQTHRAHGRNEYKAVNPAYYFSKKFSKLYSPFKPQYYWWCLLIIARKSLLVFCSVMIRTDPAFQLACVLGFMFIMLCIHIEFDPYMHVRERAEIMREEAEKELKAEIHKMHVMDFLSQLGSTEHAKNAMSTEFAKMGETIERKQDEMEIQEEIANRLHSRLFNYNNIELVVLTCSVLVPLLGIMFNTAYLQSPDNESKLWIVTTATILVGSASLIYLLACIVHEIRHTKEFKRMRSLLLWARLRHNRKHVVSKLKALRGIYIGDKDIVGNNIAGTRISMKMTTEKEVEMQSLLKKFDEMHQEDARLRKKMFDENKKLQKMLSILHKRQKAAKKAAEESRLRGETVVTTEVAGMDGIVPVQQRKQITWAVMAKFVKKHETAIGSTAAFGVFCFAFWYMA